jgi:molecular chaperone GrpE
MKHKDKRVTGTAPDPEPAPESEAGPAAEETPEASPEQAPAPSADAELAEVRDKYLRLAAEFDNFRKRAARERAEIWGRAQADLVQRLVDALDDLARFAHVDPATTDAKTIHDGVDMVERKMWKVLDGAGVARIDQVGVPFDPNVHEAVTTAAAASPEQDHTVGAVLQPGYQLAGTLIRPARVAVLVWQGDAAPPNGQLPMTNGQ